MCQACSVEQAPSLYNNFVSCTTPSPQQYRNGTTLRLVRKVLVSSLRANVSSLAPGAGYLDDPAGVLRSAMALSAVLEYAPEPDSPEDLAEISELKVHNLFAAARLPRMLLCIAPCRLSWLTGVPGGKWASCTYPWELNSGRDTQSCTVSASTLTDAAYWPSNVNSVHSGRDTKSQTKPSSPLFTVAYMDFAIPLYIRVARKLSLWSWPSRTVL